MYNRNMTKQTPRKRSSMIFLVLGLVFLTIGFATDQTAFTWIAVAFVLISLLAGGKWLRRKK
jgi:membrane protein implicated in regulation of membrane protease activity